MRVAVVIGHDERSQGARAVDGVQEYTWQRILAEGLSVELHLRGIDAPVYHRASGLGYAASMGKLVRELNTDNPALVLSLHFNAFDGPAKLHGTMGLHWPGSRMGQRWARLLSSACARAQGTTDRGPRAQAVSWAGAPLYLLRNTRAPAVILETHYGDHDDDHRLATTARDRGTTARHLAETIAGAL